MTIIKKITMLYISASLIFVGLGLPAQADENAEANALFVSTIQNWNMSNALSTNHGNSLAERLVFLSKIDENLKRIIEEYPGSSIAVQLIIGEQIGPLSNDLVAAALHEAQAEEGLLFKDAASNKPKVIGAHIFSLARENARNIGDNHDRDKILAEIATAQAAVGMIPEALEVARSISNDGARSELSLIHI